jgi:FMN phosphatase YigB (HAD superfamily)
MKRPAIEKDSTSAFVEYLEQENIEYVIFDLDGTLLKTDEHFDDLKDRLGIDLAAHFESINPHYFLCDEVARQLGNQMTQIYYENNRQPVLIDEQYSQALVRYFEYIGQEQLTDQMKEIIKEYAHECYSNSPKEYEGVVELLTTIITSGRGVLLHSHAQEDWTGIKANYLSRLVKLGEIDYLATPITKKKDLESWNQAISMTGRKAESVMVIGDNFEADILPAIQVGCKNVVWINRKERSLPEEFELPKGVNLSIVEDISEVMNITAP